VSCSRKEREQAQRNLAVAMPAPAPDAAALGRAVRAIREQRGISQVQLAEATGFVQSWISHVERGSRNPSWSNVVRLAKGLSVSVAELVRQAEQRS
jgi:transcriptional regulator with XRE-family HTH domain